MKKTILFFTLLTVVAFTSCDKEGKDFKKDYDKDYEKDYDKDKENCFELVYPVTYTMPDGTTIAGDEKTVWTAIKDWYKDHPDSEEKPLLNYPVDVVFEDGETENIEDEDAMVDLKKDCDDKDYDKDYDKEECFDFVYPVTYTMPDGSSITGEDEEAINTAIKDWYIAHPDSEEKVLLNYPVDIVFEDESTQTIANDDEMLLALKECFEEDEWELCTWDEASEASGTAFEKHIVKELVVSDDCGCIAEGVEKFVENGQTRFLIYYGEKDCVGYGIKVTCEDGNCEDAVKCLFEQDCQP